MLSPGLRKFERDFWKDKKAADRFDKLIANCAYCSGDCNKCLIMDQLEAINN